MAPMIEVLTGTWEGWGRGQYPTIESFAYLERVVLARLAGKPVLAYSQRTRSAEGKPLHAESGFFRFDDEEVELVIAQPTGIAETHRGTVTGSRIDLEQTGILLTPTARQVKEARRTIEVDGDTMTYRLEMAAMGHPLLLHLEARLERTGASWGD